MSKIKIAPSTKTGARHFIMQRISALALIPLIIWLVFSFVQILQDPAGYLPTFFAYPFNAIMAILLISTSLYHGSLGIKVVIEDYVANKMAAYILIILVHFISIATVVAGVVSILRLHLIG
jgi:succinate dehydrogenase / fumarate reductase membrane anchor subunit